MDSLGRTLDHPVDHIARDYYHAFYEWYIFNSDFSYKTNYTDIKDEILARTGYVFIDKKKQTYFMKEKWYKKNNEFHINKIPRRERMSLKMLDKIIKKR